MPVRFEFEHMWQNDRVDGFGREWQIIGIGLYEVRMAAGSPAVGQNEITNEVLINVVAFRAEPAYLQGFSAVG